MYYKMIIHTEQKLPQITETSFINKLRKRSQKCVKRMICQDEKMESWFNVSKYMNLSYS